MTLRPRAATLLALALGVALGGCTGSLYDAAGVPLLESGQTCGTTQHLCPDTGNVCQEQLPTRCGASCAVCVKPHPSATVTCEPGPGDYQCEFTCAAGWFKAAGTCQRVSTAPGALSAGAHHTCAVTDGGALLCWGQDDAGQLGVAGAGGPAPQVALPSGVTAVAAGGKHTCALQGGVVKCFGANDAGQLGRTGAGGPTPTAITGGPTGVTALAAGAAHTCALTSAGAVHCWGANALGQSGLGATTPASQLPGEPAISSGADLLHAAGDTTCARVGTEARCWGGNGSGQLGSNDTGLRAAPSLVGGLPGPVVALAVGGVNGDKAHACALVAGLPGGSNQNGLWCWGDNFYHQLGNGTATPATALQASQGTAIDNGQRHDGLLMAGGYHTCSSRLADPVTLKCGGRNDDLQAGRIPPPPAGAEVIDVSPGGNILAAVGGVAHSCALVDVGVAPATEPLVKCWGANALGQLGRVTAPAGSSSGDPGTVGP